VLEQKANAIVSAIVANGILGDLDLERILEFIMKMVAMCAPTISSFRDFKKLGILRKAALGVHIRISLGVRGRSRVDGIRIILLSEIAAASDQELDAVWLEAKNALEPIDFPM